MLLLTSLLDMDETFYLNCYEKTKPVVTPVKKIQLNSLKLGNKIKSSKENIEQS